MSVDVHVVAVLDGDGCSFGVSDVDGQSRGCGCRCTNHGPLKRARCFVLPLDAVEHAREAR